MGRLPGQVRQAVADSAGPGSRSQAERLREHRDLADIGQPGAHDGRHQLRVLPGQPFRVLV